MYSIMSEFLHHACNMPSIKFHVTVHVLMCNVHVERRDQHTFVFQISRFSKKRPKTKEQSMHDGESYQDSRLCAVLPDWHWLRSWSSPGSGICIEHSPIESEIHIQRVFYL